MNHIQVGKYLGTLMESRNQAHIFHLLTLSYPQHKALQAYYEGIVPLIDGYAETYQGIYERVTGYQMSTPIIEDATKVVTYFEGLCQFISSISNKLPQDRALQNVEDDIHQLIYTTKYLLTLS